MAQYVPADQLVETIRELGDKFRNFHLKQCICSAPMWQQPCVMCGYYPQWNDDRKYEARTGKSPHEHLKDSCTRLRFVRAVERAGGFLEFYLRSFERCLDPEYGKLSDARKEAQGLEWTEPGEVWDYFKRADVDYMGKIRG